VPAQNISRRRIDGLISAVMCLAACVSAMFQVHRKRYHENQTIDTALARIERLRTDARRRGEWMGDAGERNVHPYVLLRHRTIPDLDNLPVYQKHGGFKAFEKVVSEMKPAEVTEVVEDSRLRGRGGAGFPTGLKWTFIDNKSCPHYVAANADEYEPGTFKDREILEKNPYQFLEGVAICAYAIQAHEAYVYLRGEFWQIAVQLDQKIAALEEAGMLGDKLFRTDYSLRIFTTWEPAHISAVKRPPCSNRWKASSGSRA
jgi:hypothetical protein